MPPAGKTSLRQEARTWYKRCREQLLEQRTDAGIWRGELSSSALSTAVASFALHIADGRRFADRIHEGHRWLLTHANRDGGWGDTPVSTSNVSTTLLALAALRDARVEGGETARERGWAWIEAQLGTSDADGLTRAVLSHYGKDQTFSVPILTMCALSGVLGEAPGCWKRIPRLPFECACLPRQSFSLIGLPVVSYALPALIAMGVVRHRLGGGTPWFPRSLFINGALRRLATLQPDNGGFLEAAPLTGFVVMSLAASGADADAVISAGLAFLEASQRTDGSWPIDSDLATWLTTLSVNALREDLPGEARHGISEWLLTQQFRRRHPFTGADPGGWGWTDLPGSVPDADDTAGALVALHHLAATEPGHMDCVEDGIRWLLDVRNRDGGVPTFCRGWGRLPFDCSCADITAHAMRAFWLWRRRLPVRMDRRMQRALAHGIRFLRDAQRADGAWVPLWFGNELTDGHVNPVYGTSRVLLSLGPATDAEYPSIRPLRRRATAYLVQAQGQSGGWGGDRGVPPTIEETALAVAALASDPDAAAPARLGVSWLLHHADRLLDSSPIGLYFASLWYYETLYPLIFVVDALKRWLDSPPARAE